MRVSVTRDPATEELLPGVASMPYYQQGTANACGTTSLAMVMTYLGVPETTKSIDAVIRRMNIFTSPGDLIGFAGGHGLQAHGYNHGTWPEIEPDAARGAPCILLISASYDYPDGTAISRLHYVVVTGHGTDPVTGQRYAVLHDPNYTTADTLVYEAGLTTMGNSVNWGFAGYYLAFAAGSAPPLPAGNSADVQGALGALEGVTSITNGLMGIIEPASTGGVVHGVGQIAGGIAGGPVSAAGGLLQAGAQWLHAAVAAIPVLRTIVPPTADLIDSLGAVLGDLGNGITGVITGFGEVLGRGIDDLLNGWTRPAPGRPPKAAGS
jgi:Peptidase_C39 like family